MPSDYTIDDVGAESVIIETSASGKLWVAVKLTYGKGKVVPVLN